jgi:hypothetical protein
MADARITSALARDNGIALLASTCAGSDARESHIGGHAAGSAHRLVAQLKSRWHSDSIRDMISIICLPGAQA